VTDPLTEVTKLCGFLGLRWDDELSEPLPESRHTLDSPHPEKWRRNAEELEPYQERISVVTKRARDVFAVAPRLEPVEVEPSAARSSANAGATVVAEQRL